MSQGLGIQLGLGGGTSATSSGSLPLASDKVLLTEADDYMITEDGFFLEFEL